jgi:hypothetical protein
MSYLHMRECTKEIIESELQENKWSQSASVCELYRIHSKGNGSQTAYVMWEARGITAEQYSGRRLG